MSDYITIKLKPNDIGQIIDGLNQRMIIWQATAQYLRSGSTTLSDTIEECAHPQEAKAIADHYKNIIENITQQLKSKRAAQ